MLCGPYIRISDEYLYNICVYVFIADAEEILARQEKIYEEAEADPQQFKASLKENCPPCWCCAFA